MNRLSRFRTASFSQYLLLGVRLGLACIFILSGINKLPMQADFIEAVKGFELLPEPLAVAYGYALPWVELVTGCYLLLGILLKPSSVVVFLMSISFLIANSSFVVTGNTYCSGCFGEFIAMTVPWALTVDALLLIGAVYLFFVTGKEDVLTFDAWFRRRFIIEP